MILALDVGNTNITCGVFDGDRIKASFRITTKMPRTSDEYGMLLSTLLERNQVGMDDIHDAIICSVVPNIMHSLQNGLIKYFNIRPIIVEAGIKTGIRIATPNPQQIGADRIVDAVAAYELYGGPVLVIDFGTATTYDMVDENGTFMGGITAPGIRISAKALWEDTAKLPEIEIMKPDGENLTVTVKRIVDEDGADMESAPHPKQVLYIDLGHPLEKYDILRRKE